jgi:thioester reductase-like protein
MQAVIAAAASNGVRKLVYASSCGVVFDGSDLNNVDETHPRTKKGFNGYLQSKCKAEELVLEANGKRGLATVALRPCTIIGCVCVSVVTAMLGLTDAATRRLQEEQQRYDAQVPGRV